MYEDFSNMHITTTGIALPFSEIGDGITVATCFFRGFEKVWTPKTTSKPIQINAAPILNSGTGIVWQGD